MTGRTINKNSSIMNKATKKDSCLYMPFLSLFQLLQHLRHKGIFPILQHLKPF
jgi:hypothetical protein